MPVKKPQSDPTPEIVETEDKQCDYSGVDTLKLSHRNWLFLGFVITVLLGMVGYFAIRSGTEYSDHTYTLQGRMIRLVIGSDQDHTQLFGAAQAELERVFSRFSFFSPESETTRLNMLPEIERKTDPETDAFLRRLVDLSEKTLWHYDFTVGAHYRLYVPFELPLPETYQYPTMFTLEEETVVSDTPFLFYFGKAIKGYALDKALEALRRADPKVTGYCEIDGDILFFGPKAGGADWIAGGWNSQELYLSSGALFHHPLKTSPEGMARYEDTLLLSPEMGEVLNRYQYSAVIAPTALEAACFLVAAQTLDPQWLFECLTRWGWAGCLITERESLYSPLWNRYTHNH